MGNYILTQCTVTPIKLRCFVDYLLLNCHDVICDAMCLMRIAFEAFPIANLLVGIMYS